MFRRPYSTYCGILGDLMPFAGLGTHEAARLQLALRFCSLCGESRNLTLQVLQLYQIKSLLRTCNT